MEARRGSLGSAALARSKHRYLSSGRRFGLRKHRYLSIGRRFGPHRPARNIGIYRVGARSAFANIGIYRSGVVSVHIALLETSVFIEWEPVRPSQTSVFIDRASFRSTPPCSKHRYLSSRSPVDLRKRGYLSIGPRFGPHSPAGNIGIYRAGAHSTFAHVDVYRSGVVSLRIGLLDPRSPVVSVHIALLETSVLIEWTPVRPS